LKHTVNHRKLLEVDYSKKKQFDELASNHTSDVNQFNSQDMHSENKNNSYSKDVDKKLEQYSRSDETLILNKVDENTDLSDKSVNLSLKDEKKQIISLKKSNSNEVYNQIDEPRVKNPQKDKPSGEDILKRPNGNNIKQNNSNNNQASNKLSQKIISGREIINDTRTVTNIDERHISKNLEKTQTSNQKSVSTKVEEGKNVIDVKKIWQAETEAGGNEKQKAIDKDYNETESFNCLKIPNEEGKESFFKTKKFKLLLAILIAIALILILAAIIGGLIFYFLSNSSILSSYERQLILNLGNFTKMDLLYRASRFNVKTQSTHNQYGIYDHKDNGPSFGRNYDVLISNIPRTISCSSNFCNTYNCETVSPSVSKSYLAGSENFLLLDYEVYQVFN
jgi:hypothetical protein